MEIAAMVEEGKECLAATSKYATIEKATSFLAHAQYSSVKWGVMHACGSLIVRNPIPPLCDQTSLVMQTRKASYRLGTAQSNRANRPASTLETETIRVCESSSHDVQG